MRSVCFGRLGCVYILRLGMDSNEKIKAKGFWRNCAWKQEPINENSLIATPISIDLSTLRPLPRSRQRYCNRKLYLLGLQKSYYNYCPSARILEDTPFRSFHFASRSNHSIVLNICRFANTARLSAFVPLWNSNLIVPCLRSTVERDQIPPVFFVPLLTYRNAPLWLCPPDTAVATVVQCHQLEPKHFWLSALLIVALNNNNLPTKLQGKTFLSKWHELLLNHNEGTKLFCLATTNCQPAQLGLWKLQNYLATNNISTTLSAFHRRLQPLPEFFFISQANFTIGRILSSTKNRMLHVTISVTLFILHLTFQNLNLYLWPASRSLLL